MKTQKILFAFLIISLPLISGCAFFNTYFNARKAFNNGKAALERSWEQKSLQRQPTQTVTAERFDEDYSAVPDDAKQFFSTAIEKGNKVVILHPDSRWVEQAILLLGKAHFLRGTGNDFYDAKNRFDVFFIKYPNSKQYAEALLWFARTLIRMDFDDQAFPVLQRIKTMPASPDIRAEAHVLIGDKYFHDERMNDALAEYVIADSLARRNSLRKQAAFKVAMLHFNQERYGEAYRYFRKLSRFDMPPPDLSDVTLLMAKSLKYQEKHEAAVRLLDKMLGDNRFKNYYAAAESEIADILIRQGRIKEAEKQLKFIIDTYRIPQFTGDAYFQLGTIYDTIHNDPDGAMKYYYIAKTKYTQTSFLPQAEQRLIQLSRLNFFRQTLRAENGLIRWMNAMILHPDSLKPAEADSSGLSADASDSLQKDSSSMTRSETLQDSSSLTADITAMMDSLNVDSLEWLQKLEFSDEDDTGFTDKNDDDGKTKTGKQASDTLHVKSVYEKDMYETVMEHKELKDRLQFIRNEKNRYRGLGSNDSLIDGILSVQNRLGALYFEMADFFFYTARQTDSSLFYYSMVIDSFFQTPSAEQAMYAIAGVYEKSEPARYLPALRKAFQTFPQGNLASLYRKVFPSDDSGEDSVQTIWIRAENEFLKGEFENAMVSYRQTARLVADEDRGRALFMLGAIHERLQQNDSAYRFFNTLAFGFPDHPLTQKIKPRINEYAKRMNISSDSAVFFVDTQFVKIDFSKYIKETVITKTDSATDTTKITEPADKDSSSTGKDILDNGDENRIEESGHFKEKSKTDTTGLKPKKESDSLDEGLNIDDSADAKIKKDEGD